MCARFEEWKDEIHSFCEQNHLSFKKAEKMVKCWNQDNLVLQYHEPGSGSAGLLDETPMPVVLWISRGEKGPVFEQTEYTRKYLAQ